MEKRPKIAISINLDWPIKRYHEVYKGIQQYAKEHTNWILIWDHYPEMILREYPETPYYDGIIGRIKYDAFNEGQKFNIPMVNTWLASKIKDISSVFCDYTAAGKMVAEHLLRKGFRNFVNIDHSDDTAANNFWNGFTEVVGKNRCQIKRYFISREVTDDKILWHQFHLDFNQWVKEWELPLAIISSMSEISPKIVTRCIENNLSIPTDVAFMTAGNDIAYEEDFTHHKVTSIDLNYFKVGYEAARLLHLKLKGETIPSSPVYIPPKNLICRESTDTYAIHDEVVKQALRYISDNFHRNIQVRDVVDHTSVARRSLEIRFMKALGISIVDEINRERVENLKLNLIESDENVTELAVKVGFSCPLHMRRVFHKYTGMTPTEYRKANS